MHEVAHLIDTHTELAPIRIHQIVENSASRSCANRYRQEGAHLILLGQSSRVRAP